MKLLTIVPLFLALLASVNACTGGAEYQLKINYMWTSDRFDNLPNFPHFSPLVAFSFHTRFSAFSPYGYSTPGVRQVAETGATSTFTAELDDAIENNQVLQYKRDPTVQDGDGSVTLNLKVTCRYRFIGAITMIAPSPDWVLPIFRFRTYKGGKFIDEDSGVLRAWDAGTDSGKTFTAPNSPTNPRQNFAPHQAPFDGNYLATWSLKKL